MENIKIPDDFDTYTYKSINTDLNSMTDDQLKKHYVSAGFFENRKYKFENIPDDFDYSMYIYLNPDLKDMTEIQAKKHYEFHGYNEKRKYKIETFDNESFDNESFDNETLDNETLDNETFDNETFDNETTYNKKLDICILLHIGYYADNYINFYTKFIKNITNNNKYNFFIKIFISKDIGDIEHIKSSFNSILLHNISYHIIENIGADCYSYLNHILTDEHNYDFLIKLHTKNMSYWTYLLNSIFMDIDNLLLLFKNNEDYGIIGHSRYLQPFYYGLNNEYKTKLYNLLMLFGINENPNIDYNNILNSNYNKKKFTIKDSKKYLEYRVDLHYNNMKYKQCFNHFNKHKNKELNHAGYNINDTQFIKFIAGTIFIIRGSILKQIKALFNDQLLFLKYKIETTENIKYYYNFDHNGTIFRYTNSLEYLLQSIIYKLKYKVIGYEPIHNLTNALYLKNYNCNNIINQPTNKPKILFISNELSKTGAPKILKNVIQKCIDTYDIYLLSYYGGEDTNDFYKLINKDKVFVIYKDKRELGFENFTQLVNITKKICEKIDPEIVYLNTLVTIFGIYGSYNKKRKIILHIHEAEDEIITLYNDNIVIGYDFIKYVNHTIFVNHKLNEIYKTISNCLTSHNSSIIFNDVNIEKSKITHVKTIKQNKILIGGVGSISRRKGFDIFLELAKYYECFDFIWASNENYKNELPVNIKIVNLKTNDMFSFYKNIDFLLYTSRSEAFPLSFWECLLCNKYVLASNKTIPLDKNIFNESNVELLDGYSSVSIFMPFLTKLKNKEINLSDLNNKINTEYINSICTNNTNKIINIIQNQIIDYNNNINIELTMPNEIKLYNRLNVYEKFKGYNLQKDILLHNFTDFNNSMNHYLNNGFFEGRNIYKFPCLIKKRVVFALHELTFNGATNVCLNIANNLQPYYDIIIISWKNGGLINMYTFENTPIIIGERYFEYDLIKYLDRVELAKNILKELKPNLVYINTSVANDFYHASCNLNIPNIYHHHEGIMGYNSELKGYQIPMKNFVKYYNIKDSIFYSASELTTQCLHDIMGVSNSNIIKEFQKINFTMIDNLKNQPKQDIKINNKKIIGMVGTAIYRKGYDIFIELANIFKEYNFCWVGCDIDTEININDNLILIKTTNNPYIYINQFDYFIMTSREDLFPLVVLESLYLKIPIILLKNSISAWNTFNKFGALCLDGEASINTFKQIINNLESYNFIIDTNTPIKIKNRFDISNIEFIINDINCLTNGYINPSKICDKYYYYEKYGYITYDYHKIAELIKNFHTNDIYNYDIYKNKYTDLKLVLKSEIDYKNHWDTIGKYRRNMNKNDWKLFISMHKHLLLDKLDNEEALIKNNINYNNTVYSFNTNNYIKTYEDLKNMSFDEAKNHFIYHGCFEGRMCH